MAGKLKTLFEAAEKLEKGASRRVGALGNKGVRIEPGSKVGSAVGGIKDPKTGKVLKKDKIKELTSKGRRRIAGTAATGAAASTLSGGTKDKKKDYTNGVSKCGVQFKEAFRKARADGKKTFEWNGNDYTTKLASEKASKKSSDKKSESTSKSTTKKRGAVFGKDAKFRPFGGVLARALLGDDEKFGGERGLIDFVRTKKKPVKKNEGGMAKKGYARGGAVGMSNPSIKLSGGKKTRRSTPAPAPREEKLAAGRRAAAARAAAGYSQRTPSAGSKEAGSSRARSGAGTGRSISELSDAQKRLLRSVQSTGKKQSTSVIDDLTKKYGNLAARKQRQNLKKKAPRPPGMKMGGMPMKSKMASKGGKMGGMMPPGYKKGGSVGRKKTARGVGAAKRGFGKAMR